MQRETQHPKPALIFGSKDTRLSSNILFSLTWELEKTSNCQLKINVKEIVKKLNILLH